jgi:ATP-dependent Lon protease
VAHLLPCVNRQIAPLTGEVTLTGRVLPIGGVKEKALAARRSGVSTLIFPAGNRKDWDELAGAVQTEPAGFCLPVALYGHGKLASCLGI